MREIRSPLDGIISPFASRRFTPSLLFRANEPGYVYDLNDVTTLFKDVNGTQPVTAPADPVALRLDKSRSLALGAERVTNGDFSNGTAGWASTANATLSVSGGELTLTNTAVGSNGGAAFSFPTVIGRTYSVLGQVVRSSGGANSADFHIGIAADGFTIIPNGSLSNRRLFVATATTTFITLLVGGNTVGASKTFDNISVRELAGNHATQSDLAKRPLYALLPANGLRNLANGSADVGSTFYWPATFTTNGITATKVASGFDTDGLPYVDVRYQGTATSSFHDGAYNNSLSRSAATAGQQYTASCYIRRIAGSMTGVFGMRAAMIEETAPSTYLSQSPNPTMNGNTETLSVGTLTVTTGNQVRGLPTFECSSGSTVDVTFRIKGLQIELGSVRTAYQFNYAATNVSQPPFSQVGALLYDGVDDFMVTPAIDFSGTDKMFLCHGVRKTSDAANNGVVVEIGDVNVSSVGTATIHASGANVGSYGGASRGTIAASASTGANSFPAPDTAVLTMTGDISGDSFVLRRNGTLITQAISDQGTGNFANAQVFFGGRGGTALFFRGYEFSSICRGGAIPPAAQIVGAEGWVRARTAGAY